MPLRPRHSLLVQLREKVVGSAGQRELRDLGEPVSVRGTFHPLTPAAQTLYGTQADEAGTWHCASWPGDLFSRITFRGAEWDQLNPAETFDIGTRTKHIEVVLKRRGSNG